VCEDKRLHRLVELLIESELANFKIVNLDALLSELPAP
jgi:hypothetical protein